MRIRAIFLFAGLVAALLQAQEPQAGDAQAVIAAVLAQEGAVRGPESGAQTCVAGALGGPPAAPGDEDAIAPDHAVRIRFQWHEPPPPAVVRPAPEPRAPGQRRPRRRPDTPPPPALPTALAERLNALRDEASRAPPPAGNAPIEPSLVPAPLHLQRPDDDCALLTLSAPAFARDAAFVAVDYACGPVCGNGGLYALERREGRWQVVGIADTWIR